MLKEWEFVPADFVCLKWEAESSVESEWGVVGTERVIARSDKGLE